MAWTFFNSRTFFREEVMYLFISVSRRLVAGLMVSLTLCAFAYAENPDGTYRLVMRKLPDGTVLTPPAVQGMGTFWAAVTE